MIRYFPLLLVLYEMTTYLCMDMYLPALPLIPHDLQTTHFLTQMTVTMFFFGAVFMQLILGPISDRHGRRPVLLIGGWVFIFSTLICGITSNIYIFLIARFLQGVVISSVGVSGYATIHELFDQKTAIRILTWMGSITILAPSFGPLLGAVVLHFFGWRAIFILLAIWAMIMVLALTKWMPESNPAKKRHSFDFNKLIKNYIGILTNKRFILYSLCFCVSFSGMIAWITTGPFLVTLVYHHTPMIYGIYQAAVFGSFIIGNYIVRKLLEYMNVQRIIMIGLMTASLGALLSVCASYFYADYLIAFIISLMIFMGGAALVFSPLNRLSIEACHEPMGARMAISSTIMNTFGMVGAILAGLFYNERSFSLALIILITMLISVFCFTLRDDRN